MKKLVSAACLAAFSLTVPVVASAQDKKEEAKSPHTITGNVGFASEYRYRGISQTDGKPAVQGGFDYAHASGFYLGTWASNVTWLSDAGNSNSLEWDFYGGYKGGITDDLTYDVGGLYYYYPGRYASGVTKPDTFEVYGAVTWKFLTAKYSHALTDTFGFPDSKGSGYLDLTGTYDIGGGINLVGHVGRQTIPATTGRLKSDCSYTDYKLGVTTDQVGFTWGLAYIGTNAKGDAGQCYINVHNKDLGKGNVVLTVTKTF